MKPLLRAAAPSDAALLARIHHCCFEEQWDEASFRRLLEGAGVFAFLARDEPPSDWQAFVLIRAAAGEAEILSACTLPSARRSGLARALLTEAMAESARRDAREMFLEVAEDNLAALALYRGFGFTPAGRRRSYYRRADGTSADALILRADLPARGMGMMRSLD